MTRPAHQIAGDLQQETHTQGVVVILFHADGSADLGASLPQDLDARLSENLRKLAMGLEAMELQRN